jgi:hypothetical protein
LFVIGHLSERAISIGCHVTTTCNMKMDIGHVLIVIFKHVLAV